MMQRTKITEEYLLSCGFVQDPTWLNSVKLMSGAAEDEWFRDKMRYRDSTGRVLVSYCGFTNRYGENSYSVHIDNEDFETIAHFDVLYVDEFETLLNIFMSE